MPKILIIPPCPWYMEVHGEYLKRYLSDEFIIDVADVPYPPYKDFLDRFPETNPFQRNPDDYDLLWPILPSHWVVTEKDKYAHKIATVFYQPNEGRYNDVAVCASTTNISHEGFGDYPHHRLAFGVDTNLFKPLKFKREDSVMRVGMVGTLSNPRRMIKEVIAPLRDIKDIKVCLYTSNMINRHDLDGMGGQDILFNICGGGKSWPGMANIYNELDLLIRCDSDPGYPFPVMEAAACGVPVIATSQGLEHKITDAGGGFLIRADVEDSSGSGRAWYLDHPDEVAQRVREKVIWMRDHPTARKNMGYAARVVIEDQYTWDKHIPAWREFFREGVRRAHENSNG